MVMCGDCEALAMVPPCLCSRQQQCAQAATSRSISTRCRFHASVLAILADQRGALALFAGNGAEMLSKRGVDSSWVALVGCPLFVPPAGDRFLLADAGLA